MDPYHPDSLDLEPTRRLRLRFASSEALAAEYESNLSKGGAFVPTDESFELREPVEVLVELEFCGETLRLPAEVVHRIAPGAVPPGGEPGVAVQFTDPAPALRERFARYLHGEGAGSGPEPEERPREREARDPHALELEPEREPQPRPESDASGPLGRTAEARVRLERRDSPRVEARLAAELETAAGLRAEATTRNLSRSGALLSTEGELLPPGSRVRLALLHPETGEPVEIDAEVVRPVEGEGAVTAVAVRFDPEETADPRFVGLLGAAHAEAERARAQGIFGSIDPFGIERVVRAGAALAPARLVLTHGGEEALVRLAPGRVLEARLGPLRGRRALARLLAWKRGRFVLEPLAGGCGEEAGAGEPLDAALAAARAEREAALGATRAELPLGARLRLCADRLADLGQPLARTEEAVAELAGAGFTVRRVLDVIPEPEAAVRAALASLLERGIVRLEQG